jgi:hypothetical protein
MIGHIPNTGQFGDLLGQRLLDAILEGDTDSTAALTPTAETQDRKVVFSDFYE